MTESSDTPANTTSDEPVTGYGYLTEAETANAIAAHNKAVKAGK